MKKSREEVLRRSGLAHRGMLFISLAALALGGGVPFCALAAAAALPGEGPTLGLHPSIFAAADALGMIRGAGTAQNATRLIVTSYEGTGTVDGAAFNYRYEYVYAPHRAARQQRTFQDGRKVIEVVREGRAWNESEAGINPVPVTSGAERRMAEIYLTPHGALRAAIVASAGDVKVSTTPQSTVISVPVEIGAVRIVLGADNRPLRSEVRMRGTTLVADFSGYKDFNNYGVFTPVKIIRQENGKVVGELAVSAFVENPYVIVPLPERLIEAAKGQ
jgi:hypothetical protein